MAFSTPSYPWGAQLSVGISVGRLFLSPVLLVLNWKSRCFHPGWQKDGQKVHDVLSSQV